MRAPIPLPAPWARITLSLPAAAALALLLAACAGSPPMGLQTAPAPARAADAPSPSAPSGTGGQEWARGAVFYEVFVRSFKDSNGDGKGDLQGLIAKLDYLNDGNPHSFGDLGVDALWLMPVFRSPSYHGYDTTDYEHVNPDYGTDEDFAHLLSAAHKRGMKVIVDLVMNHTSSQHPWFVDANSGPDAAKRSWYVWRADDPGWTQPWGGPNHTWHQGKGGYYYGVFWGGMPDLNFRNPAVRREMERIADLWLERGVDGFRLDATRHLVEDGPGEQQVDTPETHAFLKELAAHLRAIHPQAVLVGENWTDTAKIATYYGAPAAPGGAELPMSFDFPLAEAIVNGAKTGQAGGIAAKLAETARLYPKEAIDPPFLTNHDMIRVATQLGNDLGKEKSAAAVLLTLPGAPFLYYGEELGLENGPGNNDEQKRTPMPWDGTENGGFTTGKPWFAFAPGKDKANVAAEISAPDSLLSHYRFLIRARHNSEALRKGSLTLLTPVTETTSVLAFLRETPGEKVLVVHNLGDAPVEVGPYAVPGTPDPYFVSPGISPPTGSPGAWKMQLPPHGSGVWRMR
jgi:alpha-amylase